MRWFQPAAWLLILGVATSGAAEPQAQVFRNPYAATPPVEFDRPSTASPSNARLNAWQGVVRPSPVAAPTTAAVSQEPVVRTLPSDRLKALHVAVNVRTKAEAYRADPLPTRHDQTAAWSSGRPSAAMKYDDAVKPASWQEAAPSTATTSSAAAAASPQLLSDVTNAHQEATRLTHNPFRSVDAGRSPASGGSKSSVNPLR